MLAASCIRTPAGHEGEDRVRARDKRARKHGVRAPARRPARPRAAAHDPQSEVLGMDRPRRASPPAASPAAHECPQPDRSHPAMAVNLDACIHCNLCVRACREVQVNDVIGMAGRGHREKIVFDFDDPMGASTCVACGECVQACPTGALMPSSLVDAKNVRTEFPDRKVDSVCPYCGVGCQLTYKIKDDKTRSRSSGRDGPANENRLCVKGRFGFDYVHNPERLTRPMIRKEGVPKIPHEVIDPARPSTHFRAGDVGRGAGRRGRRPEEDPRHARIGGARRFRLGQGLERRGLSLPEARAHRLRHQQRRPLHAALPRLSVAALMEGLGSAAVTAPFTECKDSDVIIVIGANPTENHPVAATYFKQAAKRGAKLIVMDPRGQALKRHATHMLEFKPATDVAMLNACSTSSSARSSTTGSTCSLHRRLRGAGRSTSKEFTPEKMAPICGIPADRLRDVARIYARAERAIIFWGMGISQHINGTDNARCLIALALITGHVGRPGTGLHPLRGQNNVQGASDAGLIPMVFPDYKSVENAGDARSIRKRLGHEARSQARAHRGRDHGRDPRRRDQGHVHHGREPGDVGPRRATTRAWRWRISSISWCRTSSSPRPRSTPTWCCRPRRGRRRTAPSPTPTARCRWAARRCRCRARPRSTGGSSRRSRGAWDSAGTTSTRSEIYTEMASMMPSLENISWNRIENENAVTYPASAPDKPGVDIVFGDGFPRAGRRRQARGGEAHPARRAAGRGISDDPDDRPPARALAHRRHDPARLHARRARARGGRVAVTRRHRARSASSPAIWCAC